MAVVVAVEDIGPAVAAAGDMIQCVGEIAAWRAGIDTNLLRRAYNRKPFEWNVQPRLPPQPPRVLSPFCQFQPSKFARQLP